MRARPPHDHVYASSHLLVTRLRPEVDTSSTWAAVDAITLSTSRRGGHLPELQLDLVVRYGAVLQGVAQEARLIVDRVNVELLNALSGTDSQVLTNITITGVTRADPHHTHRGDPGF